MDYPPCVSDSYTMLTVLSSMPPSHHHARRLQEPDSDGIEGKIIWNSSPGHLPGLGFTIPCALQWEIIANSIDLHFHHSR